MHACRNELGVRKLVCTSMRPMRSSHPLMADLDGICSFVSDYILYEPLQPPSSLPSSLVSPSTLLQWQVCGCLVVSCPAACVLLTRANGNHGNLSGSLPQDHSAPRQGNIFVHVACFRLTVYLLTAACLSCISCPAACVITSNIGLLDAASGHEMAYYLLSASIHPSAHSSMQAQATVQTNMQFGLAAAGHPTPCSICVDAAASASRSPHRAVLVQGGDAFDMANLLCCLLLGAGYDAYVVVGHAPESLTQGLTDTDPCPPLPVHLRGGQPDLGEAPPNDRAQTQLESRYTARAHHFAADSQTAKVWPQRSMQLLQDDELELARKPLLSDFDATGRVLKACVP